eukprot:SAG31_NODE_1407_length_8482_cov_11.903291_8_plen_34_part_00
MAHGAWAWHGHAWAMAQTGGGGDHAERSAEAGT